MLSHLFPILPPLDPPAPREFPPAQTGSASALIPELFHPIAANSTQMQPAPPAGSPSGKCPEPSAAHFPATDCYSPPPSSQTDSPPNVAPPVLFLGVNIPEFRTNQWQYPVLFLCAVAPPDVPTTLRHPLAIKALGPIHKNQHSALAAA